MRNTGGRRIALLIGIALAACNGGVAEPASCTGPVTIQVSAGAVPLVTWSPACGVTTLVVVDPSSQFTPPLWTLTMVTRDIVPPVRFGSQPDGVLNFTLAPAESLTIGNSYTVYLTRGPGLRSSFGDRTDSLTFVAR